MRDSCRWALEISTKPKNLRFDKSKPNRKSFSQSKVSKVSPINLVKLFNLTALFYTFVNVQTILHTIGSASFSDHIFPLFFYFLHRECAKVYDYVKQFQDNHAKMLALCKSISERQMVKIEKKVVYRVDEFKTIQNDYRIDVEQFFKEWDTTIRL